VTRPLGLVIYRGPSQLDGRPIVAIATGLRSSSGNRKTGAMIQTWIMRADKAPTEAARTGADASVCGDCPHRGTVERGPGGRLRNVGRSCYVTLVKAPRAVFDAWRRGRYATLPRGATPGAQHARRAALAAAGEGRIVRLGSYGDPAAVPAWVWRALLSRAAGRTGYTHQWRALEAQRPAAADYFRGILMASADTPEDRAAAESLGWRTFRVGSPTPPAADATGAPMRREILCPASDEAGKRTTCERCQLCSGADGRGSVSVYLAPHGTAARYAREREARRLPIVIG